MTVFLSLVLVVIISMLTVVINSARSNSIRFQTECVADMATQSALAEYSRELFEQYDLLFIDTSYGTDKSGDTLLENHIVDYMDSNFKIPFTLKSKIMRDHLEMSAVDAVVLEASAASDNDGAVLEREALNYLYSKYGIEDVKEIGSYFEPAQKISFDEGKVNEAWAKNEETLRKEEEKLKDPKGRKIHFEKPHQTAKSYRDNKGSLLGMTAGKVNGISGIHINTSDYISCRGYTDRNGFIQGPEDPNLAEDIMFQNYIMEKSGRYTKIKPNSVLQYQIEYIINGSGYDDENLLAVLKKILAIREFYNFSYLCGCGSKKAQVEALVLAISVLMLNPNLEEPLKWLALLAWSYAESIADIRGLLSGKHIPLVKSDSSWSTGLEGALGMTFGSGKDCGGMSYDDYLKSFLALTSKENRNQRFMDIIEMDVRKAEGRSSFRLNQCLHDFTVEMYAKSGYGGTVNITKTVGYQK